MVEKIHAMTALKTVWQVTMELVGKLNRALRGCVRGYEPSTKPAAAPES
jgi:hypothetical protein